MNGQGGPEQSVYLLKKTGFSLLIDSVALMNHSCCPNVIVTYKGTLAEVRAVQEISPGEEVSVWPLGRGPALPTAAPKGGVGASAQHRWVGRAASDASSYSVSIVRPGRSVSRVLTRGFESRFCLPFDAPCFCLWPRKRAGKNKFELNFLQRPVEISRERALPK